MKHVRESLKEFEDFKFFSLLEEEKAGTDKETLKSKEGNGLKIINKITKDFDEFKKSASGEILKFKEFWEENQSVKKGFTETGEGLYKLFGSDYVVGVLELPVQTLSDGSIEGGLGATDEPEEEIIEGKEITQDEPSPSDAQPVTEAEEGEEDKDKDLNLNLDDAPEGQPENEPMPDEVSTEEPTTEEPLEEPTGELTGEPTEQPTEQPSEQPTEEPSMSSEPTTDLKAPQKYFVVYDISGDDREEIFRTGSNNVVKAFNSFYNDTFKGAMKNAIIQYKEQKQQEKVEAEKTEKAKKETEKQSKVQKFLGENLNEASYSDYAPWLSEVEDYLISDFDMSGQEAEVFTSIVDDKLVDLFDDGTSAFDAAGIVAADEEAWEEFESSREENDLENKDIENLEDEEDLEDDEIQLASPEQYKKLKDEKQGGFGAYEPPLT